MQSNHIEKEYKTNMQKYQIILGKELVGILCHSTKFEFK